MSDHVVLPRKAGDISDVPFRQAKNFRWGRRGYQVVWALIHVAECGETDGAAEGLQAYAATMNDGRVASWTYALDRNSVTQSVLERDTAFHAPPLNDCSIGVEMAGFSRQLQSGWDDPYSFEMIDKQLVPLLAGICVRHKLPPRLATDDDLIVGLKRATALSTCRPEVMIGGEWDDLRTLHGGLVTHAQVSRVFKKSTHYDPGPNFPLAAVAAKVAVVAAALVRG